MSELQRAWAIFKATVASEDDRMVLLAMWMDQLGLSRVEGDRMFAETWAAVRDPRCGFVEILCIAAADFLRDDEPNPDEPTYHGTIIHLLQRMTEIAAGRPELFPQETPAHVH